MSANNYLNDVIKNIKSGILGRRNYRTKGTSQKRGTNLN
jgi:hypothetical protein